MKIDLDTVEFTPELVRLVPAPIARRYRVLPVFDTPTCLIIAVADALDINAIDELWVALGCKELQVDEADEVQLDDYIERLYGDGNSDKSRITTK